MESGRMILELGKVSLGVTLGTYYYANGDKFEGNWRDDEKSSYGMRLD